MQQRTLFPGQQENETIYLVIREHWVYLLGKLSIWLALIIVLFLFDRYKKTLMPDVLEAPYANYVNLFRNMYIIFITVGLFVIWTFYYLNVQVITSQRIVDISQDGLFSHTVSELNLAKIQDVTAETRGFFSTIFSFGNVLVQTAGEEQKFIFQHVPHPDKIEKMLLDLYDNFQKTGVEKNSKPAASQL